MRELNTIIHRLGAGMGALLLYCATPAVAATEPAVSGLDAVAGPDEAVLTEISNNALAEGTKTDPPAPAGPALWQVADEDTIIYLFGTVHALPEGVDWLGDELAEALAGADELVTEIHIEDASSLNPAMMKMAVLPSGPSLRDMMSADDRAAYQSAMTGLHLPIDAFDRLEPWYAAIMLSTLPLMQQGYAPETGVEAVLEKHFGPDRPRGALETAEYQLGLFDSLEMEQQFIYLRQVVDGVPEMKAKLDEMVARWLEGDADSLALLINAEETDPVLLETLLTQRNRNWADWIGHRLDKPGTVFMAVGAGHLAGDASVQAILADLGITVARLQ